jgi:hypothetical protein
LKVSIGERREGLGILLGTGGMRQTWARPAGREVCDLYLGAVCRANFDLVAAYKSFIINYLDRSSTKNELEIGS